MAFNIYEVITDKIVSQLESGYIPWEKPWKGVVDGAYNRLSKKPYSLLNQMMLDHTGEYATYNQWKDLGGTVRKGEKAEMVVFWKINKYEDQNKDGKFQEKIVPMLRYYNVFHISQVDGVEPLPVKEITILDPVKEAEDIVNSYVEREHITLVKEVTNEAYYSPARDLVHVPEITQYVTIAPYYATLWHELVHSTGYKTRLDRFQNTVMKFGSDDYSKEELIAELGSSYMLGKLGMTNEHQIRNSAAYIQSWIRVLKNDVKMIVSASGKAEKAVKFIVGEE